MLELVGYVRHVAPAIGYVYEYGYGVQGMGCGCAGKSYRVAAATFSR